MTEQERKNRLLGWYEGNTHDVEYHEAYLQDEEYNYWEYKLTEDALHFVPLLDEKEQDYIIYFTDIGEAVLEGEKVKGTLQGEEPFVSHKGRYISTKIFFNYLSDFVKSYLGIDGVSFVDEVVVVRVIGFDGKRLKVDVLTESDEVLIPNLFLGDIFIDADHNKRFMY